MSEEEDKGKRREQGGGRFSRRRALKIGAGALIAGGLPLKDFKPAEAAVKKHGPENTGKGGKSIVVIARNEKVWKGDSLDGEMAERLIFDAVRIVAGADNDRVAWKTFFSPYDNVGLKLNCLGSKRPSPRPELVKAICKGISIAGVPESSMILWDRADRDLRNAGYKIVATGPGIRCFGTDNQARERDAGYDYQLTEKGAVGCRVSRIASATCSALVNVCVLKDHNLAGVSISLKNYYGAIHNPNKYHSNNCSPYIADVYSFDTLGGKTCLVVCDATLAQYNGGPGHKEEWMWKYSGFLVSTDPVALDAVGHSIIEKKRKEAGLPTLEEVKRPPKHIRAAAERGLGEADLNKIKIVEIS
ncbi:MAG: DUF362 domain-containing protein [bacterium]